FPGLGTASAEMAISGTIHRSLSTGIERKSTISGHATYRGSSFEDGVELKTRISGAISVTSPITPLSVSTNSDHDRTNQTNRRDDLVEKRGLLGAFMFSALLVAVFRQSTRRASRQPPQNW